MKATEHFCCFQKEILGFFFKWRENEQVNKFERILPKNLCPALDALKKMLCSILSHHELFTFVIGRKKLTIKNKYEATF